jgi:hypothetical protein
VEPTIGGDIDAVYRKTVVIEVVLDSDRAFVRDDRFTGIAAGDEGDGRLHEGKIIWANIEKIALKKEGEGNSPFTLFMTGNITRLFSCSTRLHW